MGGKTHLTIKQKIYTDEYIKTKGNGVKSALKAYDTTSYETANAISTENLQKPLVRQAIEDKMEEYGMGDSILLSKHKQLLEGKEETTQTKALDMAYKLKGAYKESISPTTNQTLNINIKDSGAIKKRIEELTAKLLSKPLEGK